MDTSSDSNQSYTSEEEIHEYAEVIEDLEETKGSYDYETVVAEIAKIPPRSCEKIYIDSRVEELKESGEEFDLDEVYNQSKQDWKNMMKKEKRQFTQIQASESKRYKKAKGDAAIRPPKSGQTLFKALCFLLVQQRYRSPSNSDTHKLLAKIWNDLSKDTKKVYEHRCSEMKQNYTNSLTRKQQLLQRLPKPRGAWQIYLSDHCKRAGEQAKGQRSSAFAICAEEWRNLGEEGKEPYHKRAQRERQRSTLVHELNESGMARKGYHFKTSWILYTEARVQQIKQENPEDRRSSAEIRKLLSKEWAAMTDFEKKPWIEEARIQKEAHQARIAKQMEDALEAKRAHHAAKKTKMAKKE